MWPCDTKGITDEGLSTVEAVYFLLKEYASASEGLLARETKAFPDVKRRKLSENDSNLIGSQRHNSAHKVEDIQSEEELQRTQQLSYDDLLYYFQYMHSRVSRKYSKGERKASSQ